jgi:hypothetical protein
MRNLGVCKFEIVVDLRHSKTHLKNELSKWIQSLDDKAVKKFKAARGKVASRPWVHLKELAAYRIVKAGYSHGEAKMLINRHKPNKDAAGRKEVLPDYSSAGWTKAVQNARNRIRKLFPEPKPKSKRRAARCKT